MAELLVRKRNHGNVVILDVEGRITLGDDSIRFHDSIAAVIATGSKKILANLKGVEYVDTLGLGEIMSASTMAARNGAVLKLVNVPTRVQELTEVTEFNSVFETFDSETEAVRSFARSRVASRDA
jgi:anti-anti-sigma factor